MTAALTTVRDRVPRVSLLVPVHNHERFLDETMSSALSQTYDDYEVVVLDDGSTDASLRVLRRYEDDPRVTVLTQANVGAAQLHRPFNRLVETARGELLAWQGGDDACEPDRLSAQVAVFDEDPGVDVCHSAGFMMDARGASLGRVFGLGRAYDELSALRTMLAANVVAHPSVMMRRDAHEKVGLFEEGLVCDYHLWIKSADRLRFRYLPRRLVRYRLHEASLSTTVSGAPRMNAETRRVRELVMRDRPVTDFYPELLGLADRGAEHQAALALGNSLVLSDPDAALVAYAMAAAVEDSADVNHNRTIAHLVRGDRDAAVTCATAAAAVDPSSDLVGFARGEQTSEVLLRAPTSSLDTALERARAGRSDVRRWDGSPLLSRRAVVSPPTDPELARVCLAAWVSATEAGGLERWVVPTLGAQPQRLFEHLATAAAGLDLEEAGDISIETVDDLALLPPEADRATGVLRTVDDVSAFHGWASSRVATEIGSPPGVRA